LKIETFRSCYVVEKVNGCENSEKFSEKALESLGI